MKELIVLKDVTASPSTGVVFNYKAGEVLVIDNHRMTELLFGWFLNNNFGEEMAKESKKIEVKEEKAFEEVLENKAFEKAPENKIKSKRK